MRRIITFTLILAIMMISSVTLAEDFKTQPYLNSPLLEDLMPRQDGKIGIELTTQMPTSYITGGMKDTGILLAGNRAFCSGTFAKNSKGVIHFYTAAHCCRVWRNNTPRILTQEGRVIDMGLVEYSKDGVDACRVGFLPDEGIENTNILRVDTDIKLGSKIGRNLLLNSPFPNYSISERTQRVFVTGPNRDMPGYTVAADFRPGMSGSSVLNTNGELVGFAVAGYVNTPIPACIVTGIDQTQWLGE